MDSTAIAMQEIPRIEDRSASGSLNAASRSDPAVSEMDNTRDASGDAEVGFLFYVGDIYAYLPRTIQMKLDD